MMESLATKGFYDIYPIHFVPFWRTPLFLIIAGIITALALSFALFFIWRWWRSRRTPATAWDEALEELATLESRLDEQNVRSFYQELTRILKQYLSKRYEFTLANKTDDEVATFILSTSLPDEAKHKLHGLFKEAVALKFAYSAFNTLPSDTMKLDLQQAVSVIVCE